MKATTEAIVRAALAAESDDARRIDAALEAMRDALDGRARTDDAQAAPLEPIVRHREMRDLCGLSPQEIRRVAERGALVRVYGRGTHRSMGYTRASVRAWLGTRAPA